MIIVDTENERATFFVAAMSAAARSDLRKDFRDWGMPCDNETFETLFPILSWRAKQRDR